MEQLDLGRRFDACLIYDALHHSQRPDLALASAHRALKPGGRLLLVEPNWKHRFQGREASTSTARPSSATAAPPEGLLREAGFTDIRRFHNNRKRLFSNAPGDIARIWPSRWSTACSRLSGRRSGSRASDLAFEPSAPLQQRGRVPCRSSSTARSQRSDAPVVVADADLEAAQLVPGRQFSGCSSTAFDVARRAPLEVAELLSGSRLDEQRLERQRVERAGVARIAAAPSRPPVRERGDAPSRSTAARTTASAARTRPRSPPPPAAARRRPRARPAPPPAEQHADRDEERRADRDEVPVEVHERVQHVREPRHRQRDRRRALRPAQPPHGRAPRPPRGRDRRRARARTRRCRSRSGTATARCAAP